MSPILHLKGSVAVFVPIKKIAKQTMFILHAKYQFVILAPLFYVQTVQKIIKALELYYTIYPFSYIVYFISTFFIVRKIYVVLQEGQIDP